MARAAAERRGARTESTLEPGLPRVDADRPRLAEALALLLADSASESNASTSLRVSTERAGASAIIRIAPASDVARSLPTSTTTDVPSGAEERTRGTTLSALILASRLIAAQGGAVGVDDGALTVRIGGVH
jgi:hypothetical protein